MCSSWLLALTGPWPIIGFAVRAKMAELLAEPSGSKTEALVDRLSGLAAA